MGKGSRVLLVLAGLVAMGAGCAPEDGCAAACETLVECIGTQAETAGFATAELDDEREQLLGACMQSCGGRWEPANAAGRCVAAASCDRLAVGACAPEPAAAGPGALFDPAGAPAAGVVVKAEPACAALAVGPGACRPVAGEEARSDCLLGAAIHQALRQGDAGPCALLAAGAYRRFCTALLGAEVNCLTLTGLHADLCRQHHRNAPRHDLARLLAALKHQDADYCNAIGSAAERAGCRAGVAGDPGLCPRRMRVEHDFAARAGRIMRRELPEVTQPWRPAFMPPLLAVLSLLFLVLWVALPLWVGAEVVGLWRTAPRAVAGMGAAVVLLLLLRYGLAVEGPVNFVVWERLFPPGPDDAGRILYAGFALFLRPLWSLAPGGDLAVAFHVTTGLAALLVVATGAWAARRADPMAGVVAAMLVAACPVTVRLAAGAPETVLFALLSVGFFRLLDLTKSRRGAAWALPVVAAALLATRPEGLLLAGPFGIWWLVRGTLAPASVPPLGGRGAAAGGYLLAPPLTAAIFLAWWAIYLHLPQLHLPLGLFFANAAEVLVLLVDPRYFSVVLLAAGAGGLAWRWRQDMGRAPLLVWLALLVAAWCAQGSEDNQVLGPARYAIIAIPVLALGVAFLPRRWRLWVAGGVLLSFLPQAGVVGTRSNQQLEYDFLTRAVEQIPPDAVVVLASSSREAFAPQAAPLALLSLSGRQGAWLPAESILPVAGQEPPRPPPNHFYLLRTFFLSADIVSAVAGRCAVRPVLEETVTSVPDLPFYAIAKAGAPVTLGLYEVTCP